METEGAVQKSFCLWEGVSEDFNLTHPWYLHDVRREFYLPSTLVSDWFLWVSLEIMWVYFSPTGTDPQVPRRLPAGHLFGRGFHHTWFFPRLSRNPCFKVLVVFWVRSPAEYKVTSKTVLGSIMFLRTTCLTVIKVIFDLNSCPDPNVTSFTLTRHVHTPV